MAPPGRSGSIGRMSPMLRVSDFSVYMFPYEKGGKSFPTEPYIGTVQRMEQLGFYSVAIPHLMRPAPSSNAVLGPDVHPSERPVLFDPLLLVPILAAATK